MKSCRLIVLIEIFGQENEILFQEKGLYLRAPKQPKNQKFNRKTGSIRVCSQYFLGGCPHKRL